MSNLIKLGSGHWSDTFQLNDEEVLLVGRRSGAYDRYLDLAQKTQVLSTANLSISVPVIKEVISPNTTYPFGAIRETKVQGRPIGHDLETMSEGAKRKLGKQIAEFLNELHALLPVHKRFGTSAIKQELSQFKQGCQNLKGDIPAILLMKIERDYKEVFRTRKLVFTHGDIQENNILVDAANNLCGVVDFGNAAYSIPEMDYYLIFDFDPVLYSAMSSFSTDGLDTIKMYIVKAAKLICYASQWVTLDNTKRKRLINRLTRYLQILYPNEIKNQ